MLSAAVSGEQRVLRIVGLLENLSHCKFTSNAMNSTMSRRLVYAYRLSPASTLLGLLVSLQAASRVAILCWISPRLTSFHLVLGT